MATSTSVHSHGPLTFKFEEPKPTIHRRPSGDLSPLLECNVCLKSGRKLKLLPCFHTACYSCLEKLVSKMKDDRLIFCKICLASISVPKQGLGGFPDDNLAYFFETSGTHTKSCKECTAICGKPWSVREDIEIHHVPGGPFCIDCNVYVHDSSHNGHEVKDADHVFEEKLNAVKSAIHTLAAKEDYRRQNIDHIDKLIEGFKFERDTEKYRIRRWASLLHDAIEVLTQQSVDDIQDHYSDEIAEKKVVAVAQQLQAMKLNRIITYAKGCGMYCDMENFMKNYSIIDDAIKTCLKDETYAEPIQIKQVTFHHEEITKVERYLSKIFGHCEMIFSGTFLAKFKGELVNAVAVLDNDDILAVGDTFLDILNMYGRPKKRLIITALEDASDVAIFDTKYYLADKAKTRRHVIVIDPNFEYDVSKVIKLPAEEKDHEGTLCIAVTEEGHVMISSMATNTVYRWIRSESNFEAKPWLKRGLSGPSYIAATPLSSIVVSNEKSSKVIQFNHEGIQQFDYSGNDAHPLKSPSGLCVDEAANVYIADKAGSRIHLITSTGQFLRFIELTHMLHPVMITLNSNGEELVLADYSNHIMIMPSVTNDAELNIGTT